MDRGHRHAEETEAGAAGGGVTASALDAFNAGGYSAAQSENGAPAWPRRGGNRHPTLDASPATRSRQGGGSV